MRWSDPCVVCGKTLAPGSWEYNLVYDTCYACSCAIFRHEGMADCFQGLERNPELSTTYGIIKKLDLTCPYNDGYARALSLLDKESNPDSFKDCSKYNKTSLSRDVHAIYLDTLTDKEKAYAGFQLYCEGINMSLVRKGQHGSSHYLDIGDEKRKVSVDELREILRKVGVTKYVWQ